MKDEEQMYWKLFCETGAPQYYSLYVKARDENNSNK